MIAEDTVAAVFCGSSSARPGQPSIEVYPGAEVAAIAFPVYDSVSENSMIMWARLDAGGVVLDTIESVSGLTDSCPSISIVLGDSLYCVWQHDDSILSARLLDYHPEDVNRPPAWSTPQVISEGGYHPASRTEGDYIHSTWSSFMLDNEGCSTWVVKAATQCYASDTGMFGSTWVVGANPSDSSHTEKGSSSYAGCGVTVWQELVSGKWRIMGEARGETLTLVSSDTGDYHPHAVAESSQVSPSVSQIRIAVFNTRAVVSEVDSAVYDTGAVRFRVCSLNVSNAGSSSTASNAGVKLISPANDSLYSVYADVGGALFYARSASGDSWQRNMVYDDGHGPTTPRYPAIAEDSSGQRWIVGLFGGDGNPYVVMGFYLDSGVWEGPVELYVADGENAISNLSMAAVSDSVNPRAYAAFVVGPAEGDKQVVVAKFNDDEDLAVDTVAADKDLRDACIAVEPYLQGTDRVHVVWEDDGEVKYSFMADSRNAAFTGTWQSPVNLSGSQHPSTHPVIAGDRERVVVAWVENGEAICTRSRSVDSAYYNWEDEAKVDAGSYDVDYPTIAMGDLVVIAWEQHTSGTNYDIMASVDYGTPIAIADGQDMSTYPHVVFQNKASGDTAIPYVKVIWSEEPEDNYYEVAYKYINLKQPQGGGQQGANNQPLAIEPELFPCRPNPFTGRASIAYQFPIAGDVNLRIYDASGRIVRSLQSGFQKPGKYSVTWDGNDTRGRRVANGIYFYQLDTPSYRNVKKAVMMR